VLESSFETSRKEKKRINSNNTLLHSINQSSCLSLFVVLDLTVSDFCACFLAHDLRNCRHCLLCLLCFS
jgi:hypothetical protein